MTPHGECPKCGGEMYRYAKTCMKCRGNHGGRPHSEETKRRIGAASGAARLGKVRKSDHKQGHEFARRWYPLPEKCERCLEVPPRDRHHVDGNPHNNDPSNIAFLCRRCHQAVDGRVELLRANGRRQPKDDLGRYAELAARRLSQLSLLAEEAS